MPQIHRALLSVTDKTGLTDFARGLADQGAQLISTGGTARLLREAGIVVTDVADVTRFPEMMNGRVKTLHPHIAAGILAMREKPDHMRALAEHGIAPIDMVVVNLYRFEEAAAKPGATLEELMENIDIGGPTMIRAAAKNYRDVAVVTSSEDYASILKELHSTGALSLETHWRLARKAFATTAAYDSAISARLDREGTAPVPEREPASDLPRVLDIHVPKSMDLRYGENPHQRAALYARAGHGIAGGAQLHGKELSYNNLVDLDAAWQLACEFDNPAVAIVKHTNPAGCAEQSTLVEAYRQALACDPVSAYGGVIGINREVDAETAREIARLFVEAIAAPAYSAEALAILRAKKNLRLMQVKPGPEDLGVKSISGGFLAQTADAVKFYRASAAVNTKRAPTEEEWSALEFGWKVAKHVKSNAIVYARAGQTLAVGAGQMSRVDSVKLGAMKAVLPLEGSVVASDAFFPFADGVEEAAKHGATAFIQPGGSIRDEDVIAVADRLGAAMVFTGVRHFRH